MTQAAKLLRWVLAVLILPGSALVLMPAWLLHVSAGSRPVFLWWGAFVGANPVYIPLIEEKGLERRFWKDCLEYKRRVPRWLVKRSDV